MGGIHLFTLVGVPVRASLSFIIIVAYYAFSMRGGGLPHIGGFLLALTVSVLVHEFGHALVARRLRLDPQVLLHGFGGLCAHKPARTNRDDVFIILAGPLSGLAFALLAWVIESMLPPLGPRGSAGGAFVAFFFEYAILIGFWMNLANLLPLFPLDGGQLFRLAMLRFVKPIPKAERIVHATGIALAAGVALWAIFNHWLFLGILAALLLFENLRYLSAGSPIAVRVRSQLVDQLIAEARAAFAAGDPHEARRLSYQARSERNVQADQLEVLHVMLALSSAALEDWGEALDWAQRATRGPATDEVKILALIHLGRFAEAEGELKNPYTSSLSEDARDRLVATLDRARA